MHRAVAVLFVCLCASLLAASALAQKAPIPNLVGTWEATDFAMHDKKNGFVAAGPKSATLVVKEQRGRVFHGTVDWGSQSPGKDTFSGVLDTDNETFYFVGHDEGLRMGALGGPDVFTFYFLVPGGDNPRAGHVTYRRVKQ